MGNHYMSNQTVSETRYLTDNTEMNTLAIVTLITDAPSLMSESNEQRKQT